MQSTVTPTGCLLALGLGACNVGPAAALPARLCFEHVGPQDKPMPEFCLARSHGTPGDLLVADGTTWQAVLAACRDAAPASNTREPGSYRVSADRDWQTHVVGPAAMRSLAATLIDAARRQGAAPPTQIEQLRRRLVLRPAPISERGTDLFESEQGCSSRARFGGS